MHQPRDDGHLPGNYRVGFSFFNDGSDFIRSFVSGHDERHPIRIFVRHRGDDVTRTEGDHRDAAAAQIHAQAFQITDRSGLGCRIRTGTRQPAIPRHACDTHQHATAPAAHRCNIRLEGVDHADDIDIEHVAESLLVFGSFGQRTDADAGVGNDVVGHAVLAGEVSRRRAHCSRIADIGGVGYAGARAGCGKTIEFLSAPCNQAESGARRGVAAGNGGAETAGSAGDDDVSRGRRSHDLGFSGLPARGTAGRRGSESDHPAFQTCCRR